MAQLLSGTRIYGTGTIDTQLLINGTGASTSTNTGALVVTGGAGIAKDLYVGGTIYGSVTGVIIGIATTATNIANGTTGQIPYQTTAGNTLFFGPGTSGQLLVSAGSTSTGPVFTNTSSIMVGSAAYAITATNIANGNIAQLHYQSVSGVTSFVGTGTLGQLLVSAGSTSTGPVFTNTSSVMVGSAAYAITATNLAGGAAGSVPYQSGTGTTTMLPLTSTTGWILVAGSNSVLWGSPSGLSVGQTDAVKITNDTSSVLTQYIAFVSTSTGYSGIKTSAVSGLTYVPSTGYFGMNVTTATAMLDVGGAVKISGLTSVTNSNTNALQVTGGAILGGNLAVNGGTINVTSTTTFNLINTTATIVNFAGAGTTITIGAQSGTTTVRNNLTVAGNLTIQGSTTIVDSTVTNITDPILTLGGGPGNTAPTIDDNKDRGIAFKWMGAGQTRLGFFGYSDNDSFFKYFTSATIINEVVDIANSVKGAMDVYLAGGSSQSLVYQSSPNVTDFLAAGTIGNILQTNGSGSAPSWVSPNGLTAGIANTATQINTVRRSTNASHYLTFVIDNNTTTAGELVYTTSSVSVNPSTGALTAAAAYVNGTFTATGVVYAGGSTTLPSTAGVTSISSYGASTIGSHAHWILPYGTTTTSTGSAMSSSTYINDTLVLYAPYGYNAASVSNAGARWGIRFQGSNGTDAVGTTTATSKTSAIYAVSEDTSSGYNKATGLAFHTNAQDAAYAERMRITSAGGISFGSSGTNYGASGQILKSNGNAAPSWVDQSTIVSGAPALTNTYVGYGSAGNLLTGSGAFTYIGPTVISSSSAGGAMFEGRQVGNTYAYNSAGIFNAKTDNSTGSQNYYFMGWTTSTNNAYIRADGQGYFASNVGIGTTSPVSKLHVYGTNLFTTSTGNESFITIENSANGTSGIYGIGFKAQNGFLQAGINAYNTIAGGASAHLTFWTRNGSSVFDERLRITANGGIAFGGAANYGTSGYILKSQGDASPIWVDPATIASASSTNADNIKTIAQTANATYYPTFVNTNNASAAYEAVYTTSTFTINPSTGNVGVGTSSPIYKLDIAAGTLSTTTNSQIIAQRFNVNSVNQDYLEISNVRGTSGTSWTTAGWRLQQKVDATWMGYIQFNGTSAGTNNAGISFGTGGTTANANSVSERMRITPAGGISFGTSGTAYGTSGYILKSQGDASPIWVDPATLASASSTNADNIKTIAQTANATYYPTFVNTNNASAAYEAVYTTSTFTINPSTGYVGIGGGTVGSILSTEENTIGATEHRITNSNTGSNVTKSSRLTFRLTDTVGTRKDVAYISAVPNNSDSSNGDNLTFSTRTADATPTEKVRIDNNGNVGIGQTSPQYALHVKTGSASGTLSLSGGSETTGGASYILMGNNDSAGVSGPNVIMSANRTLQFGHGTSFTASGGGTFTPRFNITSNGGIAFGAVSNYGSSGQILQSNGDAAPTWVSNSTVGTGSAKVGYSFVNSNVGVQYYKIATLPISSLSTYDNLKIEAIANDDWGSTNNSNLTIVLSNRNTFSGQLISAQGAARPTNVGFKAYTEADGSISVYAYLAAGAYTSLTFNLLYVTGGGGPAVYTSPTAITSPSGTLAFNSTSATPYYTLNNSGNFGIGTTSPAAKLDIAGSTASTQQVILARFQGDTNFQLSAFTGNTGTNSSGNETARFGVAYNGNGSNNFSAGLSFMRGSGTADGSLAIITNAVEKVRITSAGGISFGASGTAYGTSGYILKSNGDAAPTWIDPATITVGSATDTTKLPLAGGTMTGNILFSDSGTTKRGIQGTVGANDFWFVGGGATASNSGFMEIATGDDAQGAGTAEPIYVSQYGPNDPLTGTLVRRGSLLDASGNTNFPGNLGIGTTSPRNNLEVGNITTNQTVRIGGVYGGPTTGYTGVGQETLRHQLVFSGWRDVQTDTIGSKIVSISYTNYNGAAAPASWAYVQKTDLAFFTQIDTPSSTDNTTERLRITANGGIAFGGASNYGTSGYILKSNGDAAPTWIDPSGLAAGTAIYSRALQQSDGTGFLTPTDPRSASGSRTADLGPNKYKYGLFSEFKASSTFGSTGNYSGLITYANYDSTSASSGDPSYQLLFSPTAVNSTQPPRLQLRAGIDTAWGKWSDILHSSNHAATNTWTPNVTGGVRSFANGTFTKDSGLNNSWDAQVYSSEGYASRVFCGFRLGDTTSNIMVGLNSDPTYNASYVSIDYAWYAVPGGKIYIYESGNQALAVSGTYTVDDYFLIAYDGTTVRYYINDTLVRSTARAISGLLYLDSSFYTLTGSIQAVSFGSLSHSPYNASGNFRFNSLGVGTEPPVSASASGTAGEIRASNEITAYYTSDIKLKENIKQIENPIAMIDQIRGVYFDWTDEHITSRGGEDGYFVRKHDIGVIAQEVEAILPEIVATRDNGFKAVKYEKIVPLLIEAIKAQQKQIDQIQATLAELLNK